ncbi:MAG: glycoside hydrolase family 1 protein, partial [Elusimicrobiota bacterium]|nr:glycoside hydrolase family 1 protein [Elusimicrobiota bacterium]
MDCKFDKNFWWGAASSGPQTEGYYNKAHLNIMDLWYKTDPQDFFDGIGPFTASEFCKYYRDDIAKFKELGFNSFRTSLQWCRLIDDFSKGTVNKEGREFYDNLINALLDNGITPLINLYHFDMPADLFLKYEGWLSRDVIDMFVKYAQTAFELFGDRVKYWSVINEPIVQPEAGYLYGFHYPKYVGKGAEAVQMIYNLAFATSKTIEAFRKSKAYKNGGQISTILNLTPTYTPTDSPEDKKAREFVDDFFNNVFVESAINGTFPPNLVEALKRDNVLWKTQNRDAEIIRDNTVDFLGVNYYHPRRIQARKDPLPKEFQGAWMPDIYFQDYEWPDRRM